MMDHLEMYEMDQCCMQVIAIFETYMAALQGDCSLVRANITITFYRVILVQLSPK